MTPLQHIELHKSEFTKSELVIMDYVMHHLDVVSSYPIATVAEKCKVSKSALLRFCQKCGYQGYSEFKYEISRYLHSVIQVDENNTDTNMTHKLLTLYVEQMQALETYISTSRMDKLSTAIKKARKIKIYGIHETGLSASYFCYRLCTLGIDAQPVTHASNMSELATLSTKDDLNIFLSLSAKTSVICDSLHYAITNGSTNVLFTQNDHHKFRNKIYEFFILPTFDYEEKQIFLDSQALLFVTIDLFINNLAANLRK